MSAWNQNGQSCNNASQICDDFCRYPSPPFSEPRVSGPRGPVGPFNHPPAGPFNHTPPVNRPPPPPPFLGHPPPVRPPPIGRLPEPPPPFFRHVPPPPPFFPPPFLPPPDRYHNPCVSSPFSMPPPAENGFPVAPRDPGCFRGFPPPNQPPPWISPNLAPTNCSLPVLPLPNGLRPAPRADYPRLLHHGPRARLPFRDQQNGFPMKRRLNTGHNNRKVHVMIALKFCVKLLTADVVSYQGNYLH